MPMRRSVADTRFLSWPLESPNPLVTQDAAEIGFSQSARDAPEVWYPAEIVTDVTRYGDDRPRFRVLIGPAGGVTPGRGTWHLWARIHDSPETPVLYLDVLTLF